MPLLATATGPTPRNLSRQPEYNSRRGSKLLEKAMTSDASWGAEVRTSYFSQAR
jgi:hypothetical protein